MNTSDIVRIGNQNAIVIGPNQTTFDARTTADIADLARNTWRQGLTTTPIAPTIFYAVNTTDYISDTIYDDLITGIFQDDLAGRTPTSREITFFSGPRVAVRAHGTAWGLLASVSCSPVNIYRGLELIKVKSRSEWSAPGISSSSFNAVPITEEGSGYNELGFSPGMFFKDNSFGIDYEYLLAISDSSLSLVEEPMAEYNNASIQPIRGAFEIAMWQALMPGYSKDAEFESMSNNPLVVSSNGSLGYGIRCTVSTETGFANLNAAKRTFSDFNQHSSDLPNTEEGAALSTGRIFEFPGLLSIQWLVFTALTKVIPGFEMPPACLPRGAAPNFDPACSLFYSANVATGGYPYLANLTTSYGLEPILRQSIIEPARMCLAAYKIFGEAAAAMMAQGPSNWTTNDLKGVTSETDLVGGIVPWQLVLTLLAAWVAVTVVPQCWTFAEKRWSATLDAFEMFRFGAEYRDAVQRFESNEAWENKILRQLPGMIGDLESKKARGFVGLSWQPANPSKSYVNNRTEA